MIWTPGLRAGSAAVLLLLVFLAGILEAVAGGGGGLITVPAYLAVGLDPRLVLGTNKLASSIGTATSSARFMAHFRVRYRDLAAPIAAGVAGGLCGAFASQRLPPGGLRWVVLILLPAAALFTYSHHDLEAPGPAPSPARQSLVAASLALPIGFYDGFFGPGTGIFLTVALLRFCRFDLMGASTRARTINLATNAGALAAFIFGGRVAWTLGLCAAAASVAGNWAGSHLGLKHGPKLLRPAIAVVCAGLFVKVLLDAIRLS